MGLFDGIKIRKAIMHQQKGDLAQARAAYEELYAQGVNLVRLYAALGGHVAARGRRGKL